MLYGKFKKTYEENKKLRLEPHQIRWQEMEEEIANLKKALFEIQKLVSADVDACRPTQKKHSWEVVTVPLSNGHWA